MSKLKVLHRFWIVPCSILNNKNLSFKAKWLFWYLQSKPDDRDFAVSRIQYETLDWKDGISAWLKELESAWYLRREKSHWDKGQREINYILSENPSLENPSLEKPSTDNPETIKYINTKKEISNKYTLSKDKQTAFVENKEIPEIYNYEDFNKNIFKEKSSAKKESYWNPEINELLEIIKSYNDWMIAWTKTTQRNFWQHLLNKLNKHPKVQESKTSRKELIIAILEIISKNKYHCHKIDWPENIYRNFEALISICKTEYAPVKNNIWFIPWM